MGGERSLHGVAVRDEGDCPVPGNQWRKQGNEVRGALARLRYFVRSIFLFFPYYLLIVCFAAVSLLFRFSVCAVSRSLIFFVITNAYDVRSCFAAVSFFYHVFITNFVEKPENAGWRPPPRLRHEANGMTQLTPLDVYDISSGAGLVRLPCRL